METPVQTMIQNIINDLRMTSTERYPIKAKSLTLLELCQSIHDFRDPSSRNTAQILTRRLYLHPLTINNNGKSHTSKASPHTSLGIEQSMRSNAKTKTFPPHKRRPQRDLTIHSSSVPLLTRVVPPKLNTWITTDDESTHDFEASTTTFSSHKRSLPPVTTRKSPSTTRSSVPARPIPKFLVPKPKTTRSLPEKVDVWGQLEYTLERPIPMDPPTTPFNEFLDFHLENGEFDDQEEQQLTLDSIRQMKIFHRLPRRNSLTDENQSDSEN